MNPSEGELHLGLDSGCPSHSVTIGVTGDVVEERRLADPRLAVEHKSPALPRSHGRGQLVENFALAVAAFQFNLA
jgi:hypothetical protein